VIVVAVRSSKFIENCSINYVGSVYYYVNPVRLNPPSPCSHTFEIVVLVCLVNEMSLISIPLVLTFGGW